MDKIKILHISSRADFGGGPEHLFQLLKSAKNKMELFAASPDDFPYYEKFCELIGEERIIIIPHRKFSVSSFIKLILFINRNGINIVHSHGKGAGIYSRLLYLFTNIKVVHTFHGIHIEQYGKSASVFYLMLERLLSHFTAQFISVSESEKTKVLKNNIAPERKITLIPNGVPLPDNPPEKEISDKLTLLFITRNDAQKNNSAALRILDALIKKNAVAEIKLNVIGSDLDKLVSEAEKLGLKNSFNYLGAKTDIDKYFEDAHFYLNTSFAEGLSLSILKAMAHGLPVAASRVTGNVDLVKDNVNGYLFDAENPELVADKIIYCISNRNIYREISSNNIKLIEDYYSDKLMTGKTEDLYSTIIKG